MPKLYRPKRVKWAIYLINRGEPPCYYMGCSVQSDLVIWSARAANKVLDGSDADGFIVIRSDYPVPDTWPWPKQRG